jgi:hypothetical protein
MATIFGPNNSRYTYTGTPCPHTDLAFSANVKTLGDAIKAYEEHFDVTIVPSTSYPDPTNGEMKYFDFMDNKTGTSMLVDIHVIRGGDEICPKQNINFVLSENDMVELGQLAC